MNQADENWNRRASPASVPKGFALVPVVPTHAILDVMFNAGIDRHDGDLTLLYRAILAAAQDRQYQRIGGMRSVLNGLARQEDKP